MHTNSIITRALTSVAVRVAAIAMPIGAAHAQTYPVKAITVRHFGIQAD